MDRQDILIRLLKEGHLNEDEFKFLYETTLIMRGGYLTSDEDWTVKPETFLWNPHTAPRYVINPEGSTLTTN